MNESNSSAGIAESPVNSAVSAKPFYFVSRGQPLFAFLHAPTSEIVFNHGVILCSSLGHEQVHAYRGMRHLADALAGRGVAVLRFDWFGTGDSAGDDASSDLVANWQANVRDAVAWMKTECGFDQVSLIGFRLGGLLAVEALAGNEAAGVNLTSGEIENLVLWAPVVSGRAYTRELRLHNSTANAVPRAEAARDDHWLEAGGFRCSAETIAGLAALNITQRRAEIGHALVVYRDDAAPDSKIITWLAAQNVIAEARTLRGVKDLLVEPHHTQVPHEAIAAISTWLVERIEASSNMRAFVPGATGESSATMSLGLYKNETSNTIGAFRETTWQSDHRNNLVGVVSEPPLPEPSLPLIVLLNSGAAYRIGVGRLNVMIARRLAGLGFRSLRFDLRGIGDSPAEPMQRENDTYPSTGLDDLTAVLEAAGKEFGHDRCVFLGLCSGAYFAFQAAAQFRDPSLVESILINPLTYFWREGMTIDDPELRETLESDWRFTRRLDGQRIWKFLTGRSKVGYLGAVREVIVRLTRLITSEATRPTSLDDRNSVTADGFAVSYEHPLTRDLPRDLLQIAQAGRKLTMFLAETDPGQTIMNSQARRQAKQLTRQGVLSVSRIANADHTFSQSAARNTLVDQIASHLGGSYL